MYPQRTGIRKSVIPVMLAWLCASTTGHAVEYIRQESPQPGSAGEIQEPIDYAFTEVPLSDRFLMKKTKKRLEDQPEFWRDASFSFDLRNYLFERYNSADDKPEAFAIGGQLAFESGWWKNFGVRTAFYNSTKIDADGPDSGLIAPGQENINILAEAKLRYRITDSILKGSVVNLYRQTLTMPFVNKHDIRMLPATYEAYTLSRKNTKLNYMVGHITKFKDYDSDKFVSMSEAAGAADSDKGVTAIGGRYSVTGQYSFGAGFLFGWDTFDTFFTEGTYTTTITDNADVRLSTQLTKQRSSGDELVGHFSTHQFAAKSAFGWRGFIITLAASITDDGANIRKPWGGSPTYISLQRADFDRANEKALLLGLSFNSLLFSSSGLSTFINIAHGTDAKDPATGLALPDRTEYDITVDWKPPEGFLEGLWVRARYNHIDNEGDGVNNRDYRLILNYTLPFL